MMDFLQIPRKIHPPPLPLSSSLLVRVPVPSGPLQEESSLMGITGALLDMVLLGVGATIAPGDGVTGSLLVLVPQPVTEYSHAPAYGLLAWVLTSSLRKRGWPQWTALWVGAFAAMVFGLWMEILQAFVPGRVVESGDVALNSMGIGLASLFVATMPDGRLGVLASRFSYSRTKRYARRPWHLV